MYKKAVCVMTMAYLAIFASFFMIPGFSPDKQKTQKEELRIYKIGIVGYTSSDRRIVSCRILKRQDSVGEEGPKDTEVDQTEARNPAESNTYHQADIEILERIVEAEAGGEDDDGKLLVANVVLNRVQDEAFPDTIGEVVFQRSNGVTQFSPVASGSYYKVEVSEASKKAVERALQGEDISEGALYFAARRYADQKSMRWFDEKLDFLFQHGGHEFFK